VIIKFGLKVWSTNLQLIPVIKNHLENYKLDYIEIFSVPDTFHDTAEKWSEVETQFVIHAAHSMTGLNFAKHEMELRNKELSIEAYKFADILKADKVIFHPGSDGDIEETIRQMKIISDDRMIIENKPLKGINDEVCIGSTPPEIKYIMDKLDIGFCLDFGHAIASANSHGVESIEMIDNFIKLEPVMFHLTDGDYSSEIDLHEPIGKGNFPLNKIFSLIPDGAFVTDEARRENFASIDEYLTDLNFINNKL